MHLVSEVSVSLQPPPPRTTITRIQYEPLYHGPPMNASFGDLPVELLPLVVRNVVRPSHLAKLCLVNKSIRVFATELLYGSIFIYSWHKEWKEKVRDSE